MRFCMVTTYYPPYHFGGDATYVRSLAQALKRRGHEIEVIHCLDAYALKKGYQTASIQEEDDSIIVHRLQHQLGRLSPVITQQTGYPGLKAKSLQYLLQRNFDVIHFHNISLVGGPALLGMGQAPVKLYTLHEYWLLCPTHVFWKNGQQACDQPQCIRCCLRSGIPPQWWRYTDLCHRSVSHVDALFAPSDYTATRHRDAGFTTTPIHVLPLFSTLDVGPPLVYRHRDRPQFLFVGRITAEKGILPLLETFSRLPQYDLDVVGDGTLREQLQQDYASYANIRFLGKLPQQQLVELYQQATSLIFPSFMMETFGLTIVEAFSCGTPVIARDAGGNRDLIEKTGAGIIYHSQAELYKAIHALASDQALRQQLGKCAYEGYQAYYTEKTHLDAYLQQIHVIQSEKGIMVNALN